MLSAETVNRLSAAGFTRIERVIDAHLYGIFPAAVVTVVRSGSVMLDQAWGAFEPGAQSAPVQSGALFDLASVTKLFTSTAFLSLVGEGRVGLDDALVSVVPEFGESGRRTMDGGQNPHTRHMLPVPDEARGKTVDPARVTFRHLLAHTSGIVPWRAVFAAAGPVPPPPDQPDPTPRERRWQNALRAIVHYPFVDEPGRAVHYSDLGMMLLGEAASRLHGAPGDLERTVQERVLNPLGLRELVYNPVRAGWDRRSILPAEHDTLWRGRRCWGEVHDENACGVGGVSGHAGLFGTARAVAAFGQAWLENDARLGIAPELMDEARREQAWTGSERRGLGWFLKTPEDSPAGDHFSPRSYGHTGYTGTSLWVDPQRALVAACLTNRVYYGREETGIHRFRRALHNAIAEAVDAV